MPWIEIARQPSFRMWIFFLFDSCRQIHFPFYINQKLLSAHYMPGTIVKGLFSIMLLWADISTCDYDQIFWRSNYKASIYWASSIISSASFLGSPRTCWIKNYYAYFTDLKTEAWTCEIICQKKKAGLDLNPCLSSRFTVSTSWASEEKSQNNVKISIFKN